MILGIGSACNSCGLIAYCVSLEADGLVADVRGEGAVWAVSLHEGRDVAAVRDAMRANGVIVRAVPPNHLTFCPPLVISDADLDRCVDALERSVRV